MNRGIRLAGVLIATTAGVLVAEVQGSMVKLPMGRGIRLMGGLIAAAGVLVPRTPHDDDAEEQLPNRGAGALTLVNQNARVQTRAQWPTTDPVTGGAEQEDSSRKLGQLLEQTERRNAELRVLSQRVGDLEQQRQRCAEDLWRAKLEVSTAELDIVKNNYLILLAESEVERHEQEPHTLETTGQPSGHLPPSEEETRRRRKIEQIIEAQIEAASWLMLEGRLPPYDRNECFVRWEQQGVERMNAAFRQEENEVAAIVRLIREYIAERDRLSEWLKVAKMNEGERALVWQYGEHLEHMVTCLSDKLRLVDSQAARALVVERWATLMALLTQQSTSEPAPPPR